MCGISGSFQCAGATGRETVDLQLGTLRHRGPDAEGAFSVGSGVVAQNRLAIIDLAGGDPPILNEDDSAGVVLNGEIYNFRALQQELTAAGHTLRSRCDTEVVLHLNETHEPAQAARRLDGMFAFAVWDGRRLILGRDRLGKKPLYYWTDGDALVFASEIKAVLAHPAVPRELNERAIPAYLRFGYVPTPETFFAGVLSLPPGCVLTAAPGSAPEIERYWESPKASSIRASAEGRSMRTAALEVREGLRQAVGRRLISDAPLGAFLSGGLDSSAVVATMAELSDRPVTTFTIGFDDIEGYDERPYARLVAQRYRTDHHEFVVEPDAIDLVDRLIWHHDQPFGDSSAIPTFLLSELTSQHVKVALSGDGGDELFAGYERFGAALGVQHYLRLPRRARMLGQRALSRLRPALWEGRVGSLARFAANAERGMPDAYLAWVSIISDHDRRQLVRGQADWGGDAYRRRWSQSTGELLLDRLLELNLGTYLLDDLLVKADRMSMAHGLEVRSPFLDIELLRLAMSFPPPFKARGMSLKRVLRAAMADVLPPPVLSRRKRGFGVPLDRWFRTDLRAYVEATLLAPEARVRAHLDGHAVERMAAEHFSAERNLGQSLWTLLTLELFLRREGW